MVTNKILLLPHVNSSLQFEPLQTVIQLQVYHRTVEFCPGKSTVCKIKKQLIPGSFSSNGLKSFHLSEPHLTHFFTEKAFSDFTRAFLLSPEGIWKEGGHLCLSKWQGVQKMIGWREVSCWYLVDRSRSAKFSTLSKAVSWKEELSPSSTNAHS